MDREVFREWLASKPAGEVVGEANRQDCCPLAECFKASVLRKFYIPVGHTIDDATALPAWAMAFVDEVDFIPPDPGDDYPVNHPVTAAAALAVLDTIS